MLKFYTRYVQNLILFYKLVLAFFVSNLFEYEFKYYCSQYTYLKILKNSPLRFVHYTAIYVILLFRSVISNSVIFCLNEKFSMDIPLYVINYTLD